MGFKGQCFLQGVYFQGRRALKACPPAFALHRQPDKVTFCLCLCLVKHCAAVVICNNFLLTFSTKWKWVSASRSDRFTSGYSLNKTPGGPHSRLESCGNKRQSSSQIRTPTVRSPALFWLRYPRSPKKYTRTCKKTYLLSNFVLRMCQSTSLVMEMWYSIRMRGGRHVASLGALCNDAVSDVKISIFTAQLFQTINLNANQPEGLSSYTGNT